MDIENCWTLRSGLPGILDASRLIALFLGYFLYSVGWVLFVTGICSLTRHQDFFQFCGCWIVPGWLLLRFSAGLFPFGRRLFRWMR